MPTVDAWTIEGVREETREAAREAARAAGLSVGEWIDRTLVEAARRTLGPAPEPVVGGDPVRAARAALARSRAPDGGREEPSPVEAMRARMRRRRAP